MHWLQCTEESLNLKALVLVSTEDSLYTKASVLLSTAVTPIQNYHEYKELKSKVQTMDPQFAVEDSLIDRYFSIIQSYLIDKNMC